jgi:hypothetical protein
MAPREDAGIMPGAESEFTMSSAESSQDRDLYALQLARKAANFAALSPLGFLSRAALVYPDKLAFVHQSRLPEEQWGQGDRR